MHIDDICRKHCLRVIEESCSDEDRSCIEPHEPLYMVTWEDCMKDCHRIANALLFGLGEAVVRMCEDKSIYIEESIEPSWVLSCVKTYFSMLSYYSDLVIEIIDRMFTRYEKVFKAFWEHQK